MLSWQPQFLLVQCTADRVVSRVWLFYTCLLLKLSMSFICPPTSIIFSTQLAQMVDVMVWNWHILLKVCVLTEGLAILCLEMRLWGNDYTQRALVFINGLIVAEFKLWIGYCKVVELWKIGSNWKKVRGGSIFKDCILPWPLSVFEWFSPPWGVHIYYPCIVRVKERIPPKPSTVNN